MSKLPKLETAPKNQIAKTPTGIHGLDEILGGGLPTGRQTLVCGLPGSGKTALAMEFLERGIDQFDENGVYITFEEPLGELIENAASFGYRFKEKMEAGRLAVVQIIYDQHSTTEAGEYDLSGLFARIDHAINSVTASRVVIDGLESLFSYFFRERLIRMELSRLITWLKEKGVTVLITSGRGDSNRHFTKHGIEEYVTDCVILLDNKTIDLVTTRRLFVVKYRGSTHGTNEYPFLITDSGLSVMPITSMMLDHQVSSERVSTGVDKLDDMFEGKGYYKGSSVLVSGTAGTGKSSLASFFSKSVCDNGGTCLYFAFEESPSQIIRNMKSIGLDLKPYVEQNRLFFSSNRPTVYGIEMHLLSMLNLINDIKPQAVIFDPISNLDAGPRASQLEAKMMFLRLVDRLKRAKITTFCTNLSKGGTDPENTDVGISSVMDTWILLQQNQINNRMQRSIYILKSRGMSHSRQVHSFSINSNGIDISNGPG